MLKNNQKIKGKKMVYSNSYSHRLVVLPYGYQVSEDCLRQLLNIVERGLKKK